jgi:hypothetical protein
MSFGSNGQQLAARVCEFVWGYFWGHFWFLSAQRIDF